MLQHKDSRKIVKFLVLKIKAFPSTLMLSAYAGIFISFC